jgi:ferritin-like metal-binding protein YciE
MPGRTPETRFHDGLRDIYCAERRILAGLRKQAQGATRDDLREALAHHREETEGQIERLQRVFEAVGKHAQGKICPAIDGILDEGEQVLEEYAGSPALDAALIGAAQAIEHYEITR